MLPPIIPLFPLPNVVLFPGVFLPLHIFEERYRALTRDALAGDRIIGMTLLRPGFESDYHGRPPMYPVGCAGVISHSDRLPDGRYNIVLRGIERFRIVEEDQGLAYRRAVVEPLRDRALDADDRSVIRSQRSRLESMLGSSRSSTGDPRMPASMSDEDLVNALAQYLDLEPLEKQALLEKPCLRTRAESLVELLEMKILMARTPGRSGVAH